MGPRGGAEASREVATRVFLDMDRWRTEHPQATFAEIEAAIEDQLSMLRSAWIEQEVARRAESEAKAHQGREACSACGHGLESRGFRERTITVRGDQPVRIRRRYLVCPNCARAHFPPG